MREINVIAVKSAEAESPENWNVKVSGLTAEEEKEWTENSFGKRSEYKIRYNGPCDSYLITKRSGEQNAVMALHAAVDHLQYVQSFKVTGIKESKVTKGEEHIFILTSSF